MSRRSNREQQGDAERSLGAIPTERPSLRRGFLGYRKDDVDQAFEARDTELAEMRQDVAALWLAFAQHDRLIRSVLEASGSSPLPGPHEVRPAPAAEPTPAPVAPAPAPAVDAGVTDSAISAQLDELDQVLAAIETATQTLERSYADETAGAATADGVEKPAH